MKRVASEQNAFVQTTPLKMDHVRKSLKHEKRPAKCETKRAVRVSKYAACASQLVVVVVRQVAGGRVGWMSQESVLYLGPDSGSREAIEANQQQSLLNNITRTSSRSGGCQHA